MNFNKLTNKRNGETFTKGTYNGIEILRRDVDGYINASKMAKDAGKYNNLHRFLQSVKMIEILDYWYKNEVNCGPITFDSTEKQAFYELYKGVENDFKGIYIHPDLIHFVVEWCSVEYCFKVKHIMDSINDKVHEKLDENNLPDTVENAKPIFENEVRKITEPQKAYEQNYCWGYRDSPYSLDPNEIDDLLRDKREYDLKEIEFENAEKKLNEWGRRFIEKYCD